MNRIHFLRYFFLSIILITAISFSSFGTHLRAGEITVTRTCSSLTFRITVTVFTNTINTNVEFGGDDDWLDFGDGTRMLIPITPNTPRPDLGEGIATASFTIDHTYSGNGSYIISYSEPNRNANVLNMDGSVNTRFYIESRIIADPFLGCNDTPRLLVPPIDRACKGVAWFHNAGAYDPNGDSLSYELVIPFRDNNTTVVNYKDPSDPKFYSNFNTGNEEAAGPPSFVINSIDGTLTWDAPGAIGEYNIAFIIREWRKVNGVWVSGGFVRRDMQIIVDDCDNERPELEVPEDVCVEAGSTLDATIFGTDIDGDSVKIEAFSEIFNFPETESPATYTPFPPDFRSQPAQLKFQWKTECSHVKDQPYQVVFKITDKSPTGSSLVTFKTWFIRVVGPAPKWQSATTILANRSANLKWDPYFCQNAETVQVWRRVDSYAFEPDSCQTGMPDYLGYTLITTLPVKDAVTKIPTTTYTDTNGGQGLASGAQYCYRLVAIFPLPKGGESYVSEEICLDPILADKAIITQVTVDVTSETAGQITVRWVAPYEANPGQFPPPYQYRVLRAEGFSGNGALTERTTTNGLTFTDTGLNTDAKVYNYRILAIASNGTRLDSSSSASSVRLEADSQLKKIQLTWSADVPWSNQIQLLPNKHLVFRGAEGDTDDELELIDSVDVTLSGFTYLDQGQFNSTPLNDNTVYCYKIMTRGAYGNPLINEPLLNFSQIICAQPGDSIPPCTPETPLADKPQDCVAYTNALTSCNNNIFENIFKWTRSEDSACGADVSFYKIWVATSSDSKFQEMPGEIRDTFYVDTNLPSYARCYKIQAVDRSGNRSELSEAICFDNCPYYELPNIFTPNMDGCNDLFSAYSDSDFTGEIADGLCAITPEESKAKC
ncbi:MAG: fibronectin type III domain-containing protein, partial [Cyclobacteriaceae bacterium]